MTDTRFIPDERFPYLKYKMKLFYALANIRLTNITSLSLPTNLDILLPFWQNNIPRKKLCHVTRLFHPLVNNHRQSLVELILTYPPYVGLEEILDGIEHIPHLQVFSLSGWFLRNRLCEQEAIADFMRLHAAKLVDLRLRLYSTSTAFNSYHFSDYRPPPSGQTVLDGCIGHTLPALRHLSILFDSPLRNHTSIIHLFLRRHEMQLQSLAILPVNIYPRAEFALQVMAHFGLDGVPLLSLSMLQDLTIYSKYLEVNLMSFLASSFPSLQYLSFHGLTTLLDDTEYTEIRHSKHLRDLFASWTLPDMVFESARSNFLPGQKSNVVNTFKSVERFCGWSPRLWLLDSNGSFTDFPGPFPNCGEICPGFSFYEHVLNLH
ncbi:hypothetical protein BJ165DRAFT_1403689 [Panaeolus papilionaceus]|nr:hypothetical protein BJ165DRAFT_1403689 [Panaeolus papilionaceus]